MVISGRRLGIGSLVPRILTPASDFWLLQFRQVSSGLICVLGKYPVGQVIKAYAGGISLEGVPKLRQQSAGRLIRLLSPS